MLPATLQTPAPFTPSPEQTTRVLHLLVDPDYTLMDLAQQEATTLPALTQWMARPEIAQQIDALEAACARRTRLLAVDVLPSLVHSLQSIVAEYADEAANVPINSLPAREQRRRSRETARRAAALLLRLAKFTPGPAREHAPTPRGMGFQPMTSPSTQAHPSASPDRATPLPDDLDDLLAELADLGIAIPRTGHASPTPAQSRTIIDSPDGEPATPPHGPSAPAAGPATPAPEAADDQRATGTQVRVRCGPDPRPRTSADLRHRSPRNRPRDAPGADPPPAPRPGGR